MYIPNKLNKLKNIINIENINILARCYTTQYMFKYTYKNKIYRLMFSKYLMEQSHISFNLQQMIQETNTDTNHLELQYNEFDFYPNGQINQLQYIFNGDYFFKNKKLKIIINPPSQIGSYSAIRDTTSYIAVDNKFIMYLSQLSSQYASIISQDFKQIILYLDIIYSTMSGKK